MQFLNNNLEISRISSSFLPYKITKILQSIKHNKKLHFGHDAAFRRRMPPRLSCGYNVKY